MTCSTRCSNRHALLAVLALLACAGPRPRSDVRPAPAGPIAIFPPMNLSGAAAPLRDLRAALEAAVAGRGIAIVAPEQTEAFLARHRIRDTKGLGRETARQAAEELGAPAVLISAVELDQEEAPPRLALSVRLVSTGNAPEILWTDARARAGDEAPGLFDLGLVNEPKELRRDLLEQLAGSLAGFLAGKPAAASCPAPGRFGPQVRWWSPRFARGEKARVAVLPFTNQTRRSFAGELVAQEFVRHLQREAGARVIEPGLVREELLRFRIPLEEGVSLDAARVVLELLGADFVLAGSVADYFDPGNVAGAPRVQFTAQLLDRRNNEVVWEASSQHRGDDGVFFFDAGYVGTAPGLACRMVRAAAQGIFERAKATQPAQILRTAGGR